MKSKLIIFNSRIGSLAYWLIGIFVLVGTFTQAQSLSPKVIASAGGYQSNTAGSLSFTIGETNTQTFTSATHMLTQGFQQSFKLNLLNLKAYLQGYYVGSGLMKDVLFNQSVYVSPSTITDTITIELHDAIAPYNLVSSHTQVLSQNGTATIQGLGAVGQLYYIVLKHRNTIETWSSSPILLTENTSYDFTTAANKAYGDNQYEVESGVWALYSGDIDQNEALDNADFSLWETDANNFATGYLSTDLDGNGSVDNSDFSLWELNANSFVSKLTP